MPRGPTTGFDRPDSAFTLLEIMVAVSIMAVLLGIGVAAVLQVKKQGWASRDINNLRQIYISLGAYASDNDGRVPHNGMEGDDLVASDNLASYWKDPSRKSAILSRLFLPDGTNVDLPSFLNGSIFSQPYCPDRTFLSEVNRKRYPTNGYYDFAQGSSYHYLWSRPVLMTPDGADATDLSARLVMSNRWPEPKPAYLFVDGRIGSSL